VISQKAATLGKTLLVLLALLSAGYVAAAVEDEIRARIQPHGEVCASEKYAQATRNVPLA
jgi:hypothetical protein